MTRGEESMQKKRIVYTILAVLILASFALAACQPAATPTAEPTTPPEPTQAPEPTATPTAEPTEIPYVTCGTADNPCVITFVPSAEVGKITVAGQGIADWLNKETGLNFSIEVGTSFAASIEAMGAGKAQIGFLNTFSVLLAEAKYGIDPALATVRKLAVNEMSPDKDLGGTMQPYYRGQFITQKDSGVTTLADLKGKSFCFVDPNSTSGFIVPNIILKANGIDYEAGDMTATFAGSHPNVGVAVYKGDCTAGVTFIDIRTDAASKLFETYPDIMDKEVVFYVTDPIPNDGIQFVKDFDPTLRKQIVDAFLKLSNDETGKQLLKDLYNINGLVQIEPDFYDAFAQTMLDAGVDPASLVN
jgi:phosphonate transport system substrate-binding protein